VEPKRSSEILVSIYRTLGDHIHSYLITYLFRAAESFLRSSPALS